MALDDAVSWQAMEEIQRLLREVIRFEVMPDSNTRGITPDAIVIRKLASPSPDLPSRSDEITPGLLITPGSRVQRPAEDGDNEKEGVHYHYLIQLIATDYDKCGVNLRSYLKWEEQIARLLSHWFADHQISSDGFGCIWDSTATVIHVMDDKQFVRHEKFVGGVVVTVLALEHRGIT